MLRVTIAIYVCIVTLFYETTLFIQPPNPSLPPSEQGWLSLGVQGRGPLEPPGLYRIVRRLYVVVIENPSVPPSTLP